MFLNSLKNLKCDLTICAIQFDDLGVKILRDSELNYIYHRYFRKNVLPVGKKYSNQKIFSRAFRRILQR